MISLAMMVLVFLNHGDVMGNMTALIHQMKKAAVSRSNLRSWQMCHEVYLMFVCRLHYCPMEVPKWSLYI